MNVTSADGTSIFFEQRGDGPPVILVGGAFNDRTTTVGLADVLAGDFTTVVYDRRGRGDSGDAPEYAMEREIEDIAALIAHVGGTASVFGHSSGAILALEAAAAGIGIDRVVAYEPPYATDEHPRADIVAEVRAQLAAGDRDAAAATFLQVAGTPAEMIEGMKSAPVWGWFTALAHTLPYDLTICGPDARPRASLARIAIPALVIGGGASDDALRSGARAAAAAVPGARHEVLEGQDHGVLQYPETLRPLLLDFLK
ncbi:MULTISPECIES: alpha/beta hydrolase [unclassified Amycolatopsis]|uniref:alpha/beta fold hydrolase n=1 Tax=unclassified Amycolatopsis TaxID=2618356 RepID=UPI0028741FE2|nr:MULTISPECIES: alpha/beta hydrolase [unclassified Amycolatopsis]MDS0138154.1 alpha/beta hydrolase [Amycolatopsis sp. 505]MDS0143933.1 alpha/beta hydrolase [Amycolatopsis sp. CM201R]